VTSTQNQAYQGALGTINQLQSQYTQIGLPAMNAQLQSINTGLAGGENPLTQQAFTAQRAGLTESLTDQSQTARESQLRGTKGAVAGGNVNAAMEPADIGTALANALYGSKFSEGQADIGQKMNLMNMAMGGAGTAGNAGLQAAGNQLGAISYLPNFNQGLANVSGAVSGLSSVYGSYENWLTTQPGLQPGVQPPPSISYPPTVVGNP